MDYQSDGTQVNTRPPPNPVTGTPGWVSSGNVATGAAPSDDDPDVMNGILDELINIIKAAGLSPSKTSNTLVLQAIQIIAAALPPAPFAMAVFQATGATQQWTAPYTGTARVRAWSGGGAGAPGNGGAGSGGNAGGYCEGWVNVTAQQILQIVVGKGGVAPAAGNNYGNYGGSTTVAYLGNSTNIIAIGGGAGGTPGTPGINTTGAPGQTGSGVAQSTPSYFAGAALNLNGNIGGEGVATIPNITVSGRGGSCPVGGTGGVEVWSNTSQQVPGNVGFGPGAGGSGGCNAGVGAAGQPGLVLIEYAIVP